MAGEKSGGNAESTSLNALRPPAEVAMAITSKFEGSREDTKSLPSTRGRTISRPLPLRNAAPRPRLRPVGGERARRQRDGVGETASGCYNGRPCPDSCPQPPASRH